MRKQSTLEEQIERARQRLADLPQKERNQLDLYGSDTLHERLNQRQALANQRSQDEEASSAGGSERPSAN